MDNYKITADEFEKVSIARMATHPNSSTAYGESKLSAAELKKRFDAQGKLFCKKFNEFLAMIPGGGEGDSLAAHILTGIEEDHTLKDMFADIVAKGGVFASYLSVGDQSLLQKLAVLESADLTLAEKIRLLEEEGEAVEEQIAALKQADVQLRQEMNDGFENGVPAKIGAHNVATDSHNDIRIALEGLAVRLNAVANSTDVDLDQLAELVAYIKSNRSLIEEITTSKVNVKDIIDNLTTNVNNKPLSAAQGVMLKALIDAIVVPTKLSELEGDADHRTISDAERRKWNMSGGLELDVTKDYTAGDIVVIPEQTLTSMTWKNRQVDINLGVTYTVYINETVYFCAAAEEDGTIFLGNPTLFYSASTLAHNDEPFCITWAGGEATAGMFHTKTLSYPIVLKVTTAVEKESYKIKDTYLPDTAARKSDLAAHNESELSHIDIRNKLNAIEVPTKLAELTGDSTHRTITDSERTKWNGMEAAGTAAGVVSTHNTATDAHNDIRLLIEGLSTRLNVVANSSDVNLDQLAELVAYIKANRSLIEQITTNKVSVSDIINNLTSNVSNKPLSAAQGVALKALIDAITVPTKLAEMEEDETHRTVSDEEKTKWNESGIDKWDEVEAYIANDTIVISEQTLTSMMWNKRQMDIELEIPYAVYINGTVYFCIAGEEDGSIYLGNPTLFYSASTQPHNNEPFCITWAGGNATAGMFHKDDTLSYPLTLKVTRATVTTEKKLPKSYIPDDVALKSDIPEGGGGADIDVVAEVGQTIVVEEVDADGKPTKWKAAEYQPRTHWSEWVETVLIDNETVGRDEQKEFGLVAGQTYHVIAATDEVEYNGDLVAREIQSDDATIIFLGNGVLLGEVDNGVPFAAMSFGNITQVYEPYTNSDVTVTLTTVNEVVHKISAKYIKNYSAKIIRADYDGATIFLDSTVGDVEAAINDGCYVGLDFFERDTSIWHRFDLIQYKNTDNGKQLAFASKVLGKIIVAVPNEDGTYSTEI